jgi:hypothetical protein
MTAVALLLLGALLLGTNLVGRSGERGSPQVPAQRRGGSARLVLR